jgi:hypothetical protein
MVANEGPVGFFLAQQQQVTMRGTNGCPHDSGRAEGRIQRKSDEYQLD